MTSTIKPKTTTKKHLKRGSQVGASDLGTIVLDEIEELRSDGHVQDFLPPVYRMSVFLWFGRLRFLHAVPLLRRTAEAHLHTEAQLAQ